MYEVYLERAAQRDLSRSPPEMVQRVVGAMRSLAQDPRPWGCLKVRGSKNQWRIRVGQYRVIYELDDRARVVRIMRVGHRRDIYR